LEILADFRYLIYSTYITPWGGVMEGANYKVVSGERFGYFFKI